MAAPQFDVWFTRKNQVFRGVPFEAVAGWVQEGRVSPADNIKASGGKDWTLLADHPLFAMYLAPPVPLTMPESARETAVGLDFSWRRPKEDEDDDVDMIPLIDISLVLLIFFMMTTTVAALSKIAVPEMENSSTMDANPEVIRLDIDWVDKRPAYGIGLANAAPAAGDGELNDPAEMLKKMDAVLASRTSPAKIRVAAHAEVPYQFVDAVLAELQKRIDRGVRISDFKVQVSDRK